MVVRDGQILDPTEAGTLEPSDYAYFLLPREKLTRLDSLFRESEDVARRLGLKFGELPVRGDAPLGEVARFYDLDLGGEVPERHIGDWVAERAGGEPELDTAVAIPGGRLVVRRLESGRIARLGLQLDAILQVEPDEGLLQKIEEELDEMSQLRRWIKRLGRRRRRK
jgi:cell volume regulation protein A